MLSHGFQGIWWSDDRGVDVFLLKLLEGEPVGVDTCRCVLCP